VDSDFGFYFWLETVERKILTTGAPASGPLTVFGNGGDVLDRVGRRRLLQRQAALRTDARRRGNGFRRLSFACARLGRNCGSPTCRRRNAVPRGARAATAFSPL